MTDPKKPSWRDRFKAEFEAGKAQREKDLSIENRHEREMETYRQSKQMQNAWKPTIATAADYQTATSPADPDEDDPE